MSEELFKIVSEMGIKNIKTQLALQCAPLISGLKLSNLFIIQNRDFIYVNSMLKSTGISRLVLLKTNKKTTFLLYRKQQLSLYLSDNEVRVLLEKLGYHDFSLNFILNTFRKRYKRHMNGEKNFPHEMGLLLGYPVEDVLGFIENSGKNFLYVGYWKVYCNLPEKVQLFKKFDEAKESLIKLISFGLSVSDIINIYNKKELAETVV